jgi:hypothetical protein
MSNSSVEGDYDAYTATRGAAFVANLPALRKALMQNPEALFLVGALAEITQKLSPSLPKATAQTIMDQYNPIFEIAHDVKKTI